MSKIKTIEMDFGEGKKLGLETGRVARQAAGSVIVKIGDTMVMATVSYAETQRPGINFMPLLVDYEEKLYAAGKIPGGFFKREGRPSEKAILTARLIDRSIRPLFPKGLRNDVQVVITPLSVDQENPPDVPAIVAASAALSIAGVPFAGPLGACRIAKIGDQYITNPVIDQMKESDLDIVIVGTKDKIMMIEAGVKQLSEEVMMEACKLALSHIKKMVEVQEKFMKEVGVTKVEFEMYVPLPEIEKFVVSNAQDKIKKALAITDREKQNDALDKIREELKETAKTASAEIAKLVTERPHDIGEVIDKIEKKIVREMVIKDGKRVDGRKADELRDLNFEVGILPRAHGSGLFSRGTTQVLTVLTLGAAGEEQIIDGLNVEDETKRYMHHYNFPAFSVGEVRPIRGPGRREIGHGALAEKALVPVLPSEEKFPYTIRLVSEVLSSNGSTSMASTCGSTLALLDAGVPLEKPVAGISIGLITDGDKAVTLIDIQGLEDHLGDMDFKVTGTDKGITAIQLDIKIHGLTLEIVKKALDQAKDTRLKILKEMAKVIGKPREELSKYAPRITSIQINPEKIGLVIGPGGKNIKKIVEETGVQIDINDDGQVLITSADPVGAKKAEKIIKQLTMEINVGDVFFGKVMRIMAFGAFVEMVPGKDGLVHISQIAPQRIAKVEDKVNIGDEVWVKVIEVDEKGRVNLSMKAVTEEDKKRCIN
ncbi:MAG: polyribonucleotide nucleotidyltransferase [Candidatus Margulisbacteria bacterium]|nr:polyribonucleotide nucleotidyltransferase [Candidatus Margulisiibacteriota bacterium]MBU1021372.1 polyribonucleotide nucleotidyltransferase [Candidatus Margulisiibacteriota bacterium]MBU1729139.1 polyribonucleotide nucleotidyltransferase [Candidatus Margulisiibacteriota bacterium]MBU1954812.1 polyribonucleotide nucleotidyltransferase [Candidatus Margulisiibacteriota bacterium]